MALEWAAMVQHRCRRRLFRLQLDEQRGDRSATLLGGGRMSVQIVMDHSVDSRFESGRPVAGAMERFRRLTGLGL
jgi:hypothetical protein